VFMSWETQHRDEGSPYWTNYDPHCLQRHISTSLSEGVGQPFSPRTLLHTHLPLSRGPTQGTYRRELTAERLYPRCFLHLFVLSWETQPRAVCMPPAPHDPHCLQRRLPGAEFRTQLRYHERICFPPVTVLRVLGEGKGIGKHDVFPCMSLLCFSVTHP
jgi:hypothetical protein